MEDVTRVIFLWDEFTGGEVLNICAYCNVSIVVSWCKYGVVELLIRLDMPLKNF